MTARLFQSLFGLQQDQDVRRTAIAACKEGYAVVPVIPGGKAPICTLNTVELRKEGKDHDCGIYHAITDPKVADRVFTRLGKVGQLNLGMVAGPSRMIVVDADTIDEVTSFQTDWANADGPEYLAANPTVQTPGLQSDNGDWLHRDGGHWYFSIPNGVQLPYDVVGSLKRNGYDIRWGWQQTLLPPSVRAEGRYRVVSEVLEAPAWLIEVIEAHITEKTERRARTVALVRNDSIAAWSVATPWAILLLEHGWTDSGKLDRCGCGIWTKPGGGSTSYKSATAHEAGCDQYDLLEGHGPLHLWTTDPPEPLTVFVEAGKQTLTKLQFVAAMEYDHDEDKAKSALGLHVDLYGWLDEDSQQGETASTTASAGGAGDGQNPQGSDTTSTGFEHESEESAGDEQPAFASDDQPAAQPADTFSDILKKSIDQVMVERAIPDDKRGMVYDEVQKIVLRDTAQEGFKRARASMSSDINSWMPEDTFVDDFLSDAPDGSAPSVMARTDGKALLYRKRTNSIVGRRGAGKTWAAIEASLDVLLAGGRVLYVDMEDSRAEWRSRFKAIGHLQTIDEAVKEGRAVYVKPDGFPQADIDTLVEYMGGFDLVVFDVLNRLTIRMGGDPDVANSQIMWLYDNLFNPVAAHDTAVLLLDHPNRKGQRPDADLADKEPGGGAAKLNNADGHVMTLDIVTPFSKDRIGGEVNLVTIKDRCGHYQEGEVAARMLGTADVGDSIYMNLSITMPTEKQEVDEDEVQLQACKDRIVEIIDKHGPAAKRDLQSALSAKQRAKFTWALESLIVDNVIVQDPDGKYSRASD